MGKWKIIESKITRNSKGKPLPSAILGYCDTCNKAIIKFRTVKGTWEHTSGKNSAAINNSIKNDTEVPIFCSISCSNKYRDNSYINKMNATRVIYCKDCDDKTCIYRNNNKNYSSIAIHCYTKHNKIHDNIGKAPVTLEEINKRIDNLNDRKEYLNLKALLIRKNISLDNLNKIATKKGIDISDHRKNNFNFNSEFGFMNYDKALDFICNDDNFSLNILDTPIIVTTDNVDTIINKNSLVWDLFDVDNQIPIYVGEIRSGVLEKDLLYAYCTKDKDYIVERRKRLYGYSGKQPLIDKIFRHNFCCRILAYGDENDSISVKSFESIYNKNYIRR